MNCVQMALVYRKSSKSIARKYERSPGMEPNTGGVTHMSVINPGRPRSNPFQWVSGSSRRSQKRLSPPYRTMRGSKRWAEKHEATGARLVPIDEYGTILTRSMSRKQVLRTNPGRSSMAYNLNALRRAMRANAKSAGSASAAAASFASMTPTQRKRVSKALGKAVRARSRRASRTKVRGGRVTARRVSRRKSGSKRRSKKRSGSKKAAASRRRSSRRRSSKKSGSKRRSSKRSSKRRSSKRGSKRASAKGASSAAKSASKQASAAKKAASKAKRTTSKKVASKAAKSAKSHASKARKAAVKATSKAKKAKPSSKRAANRAAAKARRAAAAAASAAAAAATASKRAQHRGRLSRKHGKFSLTSKAHGRFRRVKGFSASPFRTGRLFNPPYIHVTSKHPKHRAGGIRMAANMLGRISQRKGLPTGQRVQLVEYGPRSKRKGYAVYVPGHVSERAYVRRFHFGGAAADAHSRAMRSGYSKKRYSKKRVSANGRSSMRRNSKKRHSKRHVSRNSRRRRGSKRRSSRRLRGNRYVVMKNGRRRRLRRNMTIFGVDPINQVAIPGAYAVGGLMLANAAANVAAGIPSITNMLDAGRADPIVTKSLVGAGVAGLAIAFGGKLPAMLRDNLTPIVAGMGCAVAVRLLRGTQAGPYLGGWGAGFGEYVDQPLGAYVQDPSMGEYVDQPLGEYVDQPLGGLGTMYAAAGYPEGVDPGDQSSVDGLMDVMEAAAGVGPFEAAAGMGTLYAAAGLGAGEMGVTGSPIAVPTYTPPRGPGGMQQPPFVSIQDPIDGAREVTSIMRRDLPIPRGIVTAEGRGSAGGIFSRSIFGGMMS